jgi:hypothetical protein
MRRLVLLFFLFASGLVQCQNEGFNWSKERRNYNYPSSGKKRLPDVPAFSRPEFSEKDFRHQDDKPPSPPLTGEQGGTGSKTQPDRFGGTTAGSSTSGTMHHDEDKIEAYRNDQTFNASTGEQGENSSKESGKGNSNSDKSTFSDSMELEEPIEDIESDKEISVATLPSAIGKVLLGLLLIGLLVWGLYYWFMNREPKTKTTPPNPSEQSPERYSLSELEIALETAKKEGDFREAVRIYFTFILKELISKQWIYWQDDKTNYHYLDELRTRTEAHSFSDCIRIYEQIWYGEYPISESQFSLIEPLFKAFHQQVVRNQ